MPSLFWRMAILFALALPTATPAAPVAFTDMLGNAVTLPAPTTRSVTLPMPASALFMSLDGGPAHLLGMHPNAHALLRKSLLSRIFPDAARVRADITQSGFVPNVETLLGLQPDLVWQWGHMGDDLIAPLRAAGLPVAALVYGDEARTRQWIRLMGTALGREAQAARQLQWRQAVHDDVRQATAALSTEARPSVLFVSHRFPSYRVAGHNTSMDGDITLAGGRNVAAEIRGTAGISVEQLLAWEPQVILLGNFDTSLTPQAIYDDPLLADTPAVRHRRVYKVPMGGYPWDPPSQESPLYWQWLAMVLHPAQHPWPLRARIASAYSLLYGYTPSAADLDALLHLPLNQASADYARFRE